MKSEIKNMTEGKPLKLIALFAIPMLVGNLFQQIYNIADSIIVGKMLGKDALAAVGATGNITFLFFALCNGIGSGGGIVMSQYFGRREDDNVKTCILNTAYIMFIFPLIVGIIAFFCSTPLLLLLKTPEDIMAQSVLYLRTMCVGIVFVSMYNFVSSTLRALGDSKTPLYFLIISSIINIGLDIWFVKLGFGVFGAGLATVIAQALSGFGCIIYALKRNSYFIFERKHYAINTHIIKQTIRLGVPLSLQFAMISISCMALQRVINSFGAVAVAANTAVVRIETVIHQPYQTMGATLSTFTGQNYGAKKFDRVKKGYIQGAVIVLVFSLIMLPIMQFFGSNIISIFVSEPEVIEMGARAIKISSLFYVFLATIYVTRGVLGGLGDAFFSLINGIVEVIGRFTVPFWLTAIPSIGIWGIWWSVGIVWSLAGITALMRYFQYKKRVMK